MEVGDFDGDGDEDVLIGAHNLQPNSSIAKKWGKYSPAILLLENYRIKKNKLFL